MAKYNKYKYIPSGAVEGSGGGASPAQLATKQDKVIPAAVGNIQGLDALGNTIDLGYTIADLQALISQGIVKVVNTIADRDAIIASERVEGLEAFVIDATGDTTVNAGGAAYILKAGLTNTDWVKTYEAESLDLILSAANISYNNTTSGATSTNLQDATDEAFARIVTVENRPVGNSGEGKRYFISTPATAGIYSATEIFTESPTTITKTFTTTYETVFEAETQALNITAIPSGGWNTDISFTHTNDKDFTAKVSFYNGATLLGEIESPVLAGNEKIVLSKTFPTFAFTSGNKLKFKLEAKSDHNGDISVFTNDGTNDLHIHTPVLIDVVNSAVQSALDLKQNLINATASSQSAMLALTGLVAGDIIIRMDLGNAQFQLTTLPATNLANWRQLSISTPTPVISTTVNGVVNGGSSMPAVDGLYAIKVAPSGGLPIGSVGDILKRTSGVWTIDTTWASAGASIYNLGDQKTYNKANVGFNTWNVGVSPLVYNVRATGDNSKSGGYTTLQNAFNAYETDYGASLGTIGVIQIYDTNLNEIATWNPSNNAQNLIVIGIGDKYRSFTQITQIILGRNAHRVTLSKIMGSTSGTLAPFVVQCSGTLTENGAVGTPRGKIIFDQCSISTNGNVGVDIQSCENFITASGCDFNNKIVNFTDVVPDTSKTAAQIQAQATTYTGILFKASDTGAYYKANGTVWQLYNDKFALPTALYFDNTQNAAIYAGINRFVTKNATCSTIIEISNNNNLLEYGYVVGALNTNTDYDTVLALGSVANGYYLANFTRTKTVSAVNATTNTLTITGHGLSTGDLASFTASTLPAPIVANKKYGVIKIDNNTISIVDPLIAGTPAPVDITGTTITAGVCTVFSAGSVLLRISPNTVIDSQHYNANNTYYDAISRKTYAKKDGLFAEVAGGGTADGSRLIKTVTQNAHGFSVGKLLALNGGAYVLADNRYLTSLPCIGFVDSVVDVNTFVLGINGDFTTFTGLTPYVPSFVGIDGNITSTPPTTYKQIVLNAVSATEAFFNPSQEVVSATGFASNPFIIGEIKYLDEVADFTTIFGRWLLRNGRAISRTTYSEYFPKATVQFTGNITNGSNVITNVADTTQFAVGRAIEGVGIPAGATIASITTNTITLQTGQNATATTTGVSLRYFKYGNGDGSTTYNIEDARGRVDGAIGQGTGLTNRKAGDIVGTQTETLTAAQIPANVFVNRPTGALESGGSAFVSTLNTGGGQPHNNMQPTIFSKNSFVFVGTN